MTIKSWCSLSCSLCLSHPGPQPLTSNTGKLTVLRYRVHHSHFLPGTSVQISGRAKDAMIDWLMHPDPLMCCRATTVGDIRLSIKTKPLGMACDDSRHTSTRKGRTEALRARRHPAARWKVPYSRAGCRGFADPARKSISSVPHEEIQRKPSHHRSTRFCRAAISRLAFWSIQALRAWLSENNPLQIKQLQMPTVCSYVLGTQLMLPGLPTPTCNWPRKRNFYGNRACSHPTCPMRLEIPAVLCASPDTDRSPRDCCRLRSAGDLQSSVGWRI